MCVVVFFRNGGSEEDPDGLVDKYLGDATIWVKVSAADGVNEHGHGVGCKCSWCRGVKGEKGWKDLGKG